MRRLAVLIAAAAALSAASLAPAEAQTAWNHGCFRYGPTGFHHYDFCIGPDFLYAHQRICDHGGSCWYR
jgi:hypothetical protein